MTAADRLLERLDGVSRVRNNRWRARCPAHDDRIPSLSILELPGDRVLIHCFAQCSAADIVAAVGLELSDLFEPTVGYGQAHRERRPWPASDVLRCIAYEATVAAVGAAMVADAREITPAERARLVMAAARLRAAARIAGVSHD